MRKSFIAAIYLAMAALAMAPQSAVAQAAAQVAAQATAAQATAAQATAAQTALPGLSRYRLSNGLELYVYVDDAVPLARMQLVFRSGAAAQTPETAGFLHLYEHLLFDGGTGGPGPGSMKAALAELGATDADGQTTAESVGWRLTVPAERVADAMGLLARPLASPSFGQEDLDAARDAVLQESTAAASAPGAVYQAAMLKRLFQKFPWRRDPAGSEKALRAATLDQLRAVGRAWFVPNAAALLVGGAVDPEAVRAAAESAFAAWKAGDDPWKKPPAPHPRPGVPRPSWLVCPDPSIPEGTALVEARYRGPDLATDPGSSYVAELWGSLLSAPGTRFKAAIAKNQPGLLGEDTVEAWYFSQREGSTLSFSCILSVDAAKGIAAAARNFKERARGFEMTTMRSDLAYFTSDEYALARRRILAERERRLDGAEGVLQELAFWWSAASVDYFLGFPDAIAKVGPKELSTFVDAYIMKNLEVVGIRMNPADYERERKTFENSGYDLVTAANAWWWQK